MMYSPKISWTSPKSVSSTKSSWTFKKYKETTAADNIKNNQQNEEAIIIDNIIEELDKKREIVINKKKEAQLRDKVSMYRLEENTLNYVIFRIHELTGKLV